VQVLGVNDARRLDLRAELLARAICFEFKRLSV